MNIDFRQPLIMHVLKVGYLDWLLDYMLSKVFTASFFENGIIFSEDLGSINRHFNLMSWIEALT